MIKRVNFTGRKRVPQACANIVVHDGEPRTFDAVIDLEASRLPENARVFLEAMCSGSSVVKRFDFGRVGSIVAPDNRTLGEVPGEKVFFALKVVDETERYGRILGIAEGLRPDASGERYDSGRRGLLPVDERPLGQEMWALDYGEHEVSLLVNSDVPGLRERWKYDPFLQALVYPAVVRMILSKAIDLGGTPEGEDERWPTLWLRFGQLLHFEHTAPPTKDDNEDDIEEWICEVVTRFTEQHSLRDCYLRAAPYQEGDSA